MAPGPNSTPNLAHEGRIAQIHVSKPPVYSLTNVVLLTHPTPSPGTTRVLTGIPDKMDLTMILCN